MATSSSWATRRTSRSHVYARPRLNARDDDQVLFSEGPVDSAPIPNVKFGPDDFLLDHWDESIHLLVFTGREALPSGITALQQRLRGWMMRGRWPNSSTTPRRICEGREREGEIQGRGGIISSKRQNLPQTTRTSERR